MTLHESSFSGPRAFARWLLSSDDRLLIKPDGFHGIKPVKNLAIEMLLFRESCWQCALVYVFPNTVVPQHRHMRVASCEMVIGGAADSEATIGGRVLARMRAGQSLRSQMFLIDAGQWHGGSAGANGLLWLSFQHWREGPVGWIGDDWEDQ